jgi:hypothetical protein
MARKELTKSKAVEYQKASKKRKGQILDRLCEDTGWSRDNARRQLKKSLFKDCRQKLKKHSRAYKYSSKARCVLTNVWMLSGTTCGQYLKAQIDDGLLERLVAHEELRSEKRNAGDVVRIDDLVIAELKQMSSATIDRYLKYTKKTLEPLSRAATKKSSYPLRNEIPFGKSHAQVDMPGYLSIDTVAHCGHTLKGDHLWTLNATDVFIGWTETITVKNKASRWIKEGHEEILPAFPFTIVAANYDGGSEFINKEMIDFAKLMHYQMTRSRPYHSNDNAHVEQKNADIVRKYAFRYRYEGQDALNTLNKLWYWVNLRKNYLIPTKKCIGHTKTTSGRTRGIYDKPQTPYRRVMQCEQVSKQDKGRLEKIFNGLNDAHITRMINQLQQQLLTYTSDKELLDYVQDVLKVAQAA